LRFSLDSVFCFDDGVEMKWWCIEKDQCENAQKKEKEKKKDLIQ